VCGDAFRDALAAAQAGGDQVEGVAAVDLGAGRATGGAAVVAADQEVTGREAGGVEAVEDVADLTGAGVDVVFGAVAVEADRVGAAAES
jgi:predicted metal-dependent phosphotriesterase family hydrolase